MFCRLSQFLVLSVGLFILGGCGPTKAPVAKVHGTVTMQGQPLTGAVIGFESEDGSRSVTAELDAQGKFVVRTYADAGVPPGKYKVTVKPLPPPTDQPPLAGDALTSGPLESSIPKKYFSTGTSGLTADVVLEKDNDLTFDLKP
ncbi:carboxypeptidase-like regulatory domain-containing protein [Anatilimnocola sp. NA78]|uniref:carboxypeptidase-like regulatory domain-containing protein n=1 Tax=Anatilimnocola sp. NA78 TaxID=3415683 RepID=UPI003CE4C577